MEFRGHGLPRGRLRTKLHPCFSQRVLMLGCHVGTLIMKDLNANSGMLFVTIASGEDILHEFVKNVE